jgi:two-component system nitrogen regulation response regulator GlnG
MTAGSAGNTRQRLSGASDTAAPAPSASILLVEDEPIVLRVLADALEDSGFSVTTSDNCQDAVRLLEAGTFDLLITDLVLGDGNGVALIDEASHRGIPSVGISGHPVQINGVIGPGGPLASRLLAKPFQPDRLVEAAISLLSEKAAKP